MSTHPGRRDRRAAVGAAVVAALHAEYWRVDEMGRLAAAIGGGDASAAHDIARRLPCGVVDVVRAG